MKAFLLSAGLGSRLKPLTDDIPKCLVEVCGKPLLYIWLDLLERDGVEEVLINTHYFADKVEEAIRKRNNKIKVKLFYEEELLGSGGTVLANEDFVRNEKDFFFIFADNLSNVSLKKIYDFHVKNDSLFTTYVYKTDVPKQKGIFVSDDSGKVLGFEEKPEFPKSNLASAGIGVLSSEVFEIFKNSEELRVKSLESKVKSEEEKLKVKSEEEKLKVKSEEEKLRVKSEEEKLRVKSEELKVKNSDEVTKIQSDDKKSRDDVKDSPPWRGTAKPGGGSANDVVDFGKDVMPMLIGNMYVMETTDYIRDIGTMKDLEEAREEYSQL